MAVIETGLGGRLDATNVLSPVLTVTTDINRDHIEILGRSLRKIAREKAGIIKPGTPHLIGPLRPEAKEVMREFCRKHGSPFYQLRKASIRPGRTPFRFDFVQNGWAVNSLKSSLPGQHQTVNGALAVAAAGLLRDSGWRISKQAVRRGLQAAYWPGRFQIVALPEGPRVILDVGHNASGIAAFTDTFRRMYGGRRVPIITGFVKRKEHQTMISSLARIASEFLLVPLKTGRSVDIREMQERLDWHDVPCRRRGSLTTAYERLRESSGPDDIIIIVGSHYLVGEFLQKYLWK